MSSQLRLACILALLSVTLSCGGSDDLGVNNVSPSGSVGGIVVDAATREPMADVKITIVAGGKQYPAEAPAATDATGRFGVQGVPAGDLIVRFEGPATHAKLELSATLQNAAGDFPLANATLSLGPIGMVQTTADTNAFKVRLVQPDGQPASGLKTQLRSGPSWIDFSNTTGTARGNIVVSATSSAIGEVAFKGIPDFALLGGLIGVGGVSDTVRLVVPPQDINNDGRIDFVGTQVDLSVNKLVGSIPTVVVGSATAPALEILATTIPALAGKAGNRAVAAVGGPLFVVFNWPIIKDQTQALLYDELGQPATAPTLNVDGTTMQMSFTNLKPGAEYNLNLRAVAEADGQVIEKIFGAPFFTPPMSGSKPTVTLTRDPNNPRIIRVLFNEPLGIGVAGNLGGGNALLYFDYDIDGSGAKGDSPAEIGASSSNVTLVSDEQDPPGAAGVSGIATRWHFTIPQDNQSNDLPVGTTVNFSFSRMGTPMIRGTGELAEDLTSTIPN
ncbi:MAG: carboxypeptidase regulatory-like domain-containing protein [Myxococcales bacterium]|nr:carboxypeptidase regulatory-like domain-containing protein [Myxococcales bacterium]